jgi:hypothetical protein
MRNGGKVVVQINNPYLAPAGMGHFAAYETVFPDVDRSSIRFYGTWLTAQVRKLYLRAATSFPAGSLARGVLAGLALVTLAPMAWLANRAAVNRDASAFTPNWTSVVLELEVARKDVSAPHCAKRGTSERMHAKRDTI